MATGFIRRDQKGVQTHPYDSSLLFVIALQTCWNSLGLCGFSQYQHIGTVSHDAKVSM